MRVRVGNCPLCGQPNVLDLPDHLAERVMEWDAEGRPDHVQDVFPELSLDDREALISGSHGPCFDRAFPEGD